MEKQNLVYRMSLYTFFTVKIFTVFRETENSYRYHAGYDQPIQQPLYGHYNGYTYNVKSPYHINPVYEPFSHQAAEYPTTNYRSEPNTTNAQYSTADYPDVRKVLFILQERCALPEEL